MMFFDRRPARSGFDIVFRRQQAPFLLLALLLLSCGCKEAPSTTFQGYVEGEFVYVASPIGGRLDALNVRKGQSVKQTDPLFALEHDLERSVVREAEEKVRQAVQNLANLEKGKRPSEIQAIEARLKSAEAALALARMEYDRRMKLSKREFISTEDLDRARTDKDVKQQQVLEIAAELKTARLGARPDEIKGARAEAEAARARLAQARWNLDQKSQMAKTDALVFDTYYYCGEWVPAGRPVVSLLPPENIKVRFFVPETVVGRLSLNEKVGVSWDGGTTVVGRIAYISPRAEYTPPVIYSTECRAKLVFLIEAVFDPDSARLLHPGQPVDVSESPSREDPHA